MNKVTRGHVQVVVSVEKQLTNQSEEMFLKKGHVKNLKKKLQRGSRGPHKKEQVPGANEVNHKHMYTDCFWSREKTAGKSEQMGVNKG